jgi:hypothetical protein
VTDDSPDVGICLVVSVLLLMVMVSLLMLLFDGSALDCAG